jgi:hypothetical protein
LEAARRAAAIDAAAVLAHDAGFVQVEGPAADVFLHEMQSHPYWRERHMQRGARSSALGEEELLERLFGTTLALSRHKPAAEARERLRALAGPASGAFASPAQEHLFTALTEGQLAACLGVVAVALVVLLNRLTPARVSRTRRRFRRP